MQKVPGIKAHHAIITDNCRRVQGGDSAAFDEAVRRTKVEYDRAVTGRAAQKGVEYHLVLTVLPPDHRDKQKDDPAPGT